LSKTTGFFFTAVINNFFGIGVGFVGGLVLIFGFVLIFFLIGFFGFVLIFLIINNLLQDLIFKIISTILLMTCILCEKNSVEFWFGSLCAKCRRVKHLLSIFNERVYEVLEEVLIKNEDEQDVKIKEELKIELTKNEYNLRNKKKNTTE